jgi:hypothetical protein
MQYSSCFKGHVTFSFSFQCTVGGTFGSYSLPLIELSQNGSISRRLVSIAPEKPHITMTLSANVKMATL